MTVRWMSLRRGNAKLFALVKAACENVLSALIARSAALRVSILPAT